ATKADPRVTQTASQEGSRKTSVVHVARPLPLRPRLTDIHASSTRQRSSSTGRRAVEWGRGGSVIAWLARLMLLAAGAWTARAYARDFVRDYIRRLVRDRLRAGLLLTASQLALLAIAAFAVHRSGDPLGGRLLGSALVWLL